MVHSPQFTADGIESQLLVAVFTFYGVDIQKKSWTSVQLNSSIQFKNSSIACGKTSRLDRPCADKCALQNNRAVPESPKPKTLP